MSNSTNTIQLPSGTGLTMCLNLPTWHSWLGEVVGTFISTQPMTNVTMQIVKNAPNVSPTYQTIWNNITIPALVRKLFMLNEQYQTACKITYTCTADVSFCVETRTAWY